MSGRYSRDAFRRVFLQYVGCDAFRDTLRGLMRQVSREVRVSRRGLSPGVAKEFLYHESPPRARTARPVLLAANDNGCRNLIKCKSR